jgi:methyl-accepting chemotaxis protein
MERLNNQTKLIGEIISTVDDLAQQSNLLAVNASIEAAKAGEQGKGFGVVAQEVKKLSKQSKVATAHVRKILNDVVGAGGDAIIAAERGSRAVDAGHIQAGDTGQVIRTLTTSISRASEATELIAVSSQQQLIGMKQMVQAMDHIRLSSEQNSKFAVELEKYSRQLADVGNKLVAMDADEVELSLDEA